MQGLKRELVLVTKQVEDFRDQLVRPKASEVAEDMEVGKEGLPRWWWRGAQQRLRTRRRRRLRGSWSGCGVGGGLWEEGESGGMGWRRQGGTLMAMLSKDRKEVLRWLQGREAEKETEEVERDEQMRYRSFIGTLCTLPNSTRWILPYEVLPRVGNGPWGAGVQEFAQKKHFKKHVFFKGEDSLKMHEFCTQFSCVFTRQRDTAAALEREVVMESVLAAAASELRRERGSSVCVATDLQGKRSVLAATDLQGVVGL